MNDHLKHLVEERKLSRILINSHEIGYNSDRFCLSFPIKDEYGQLRGCLEYRPGETPKYMYSLQKTESPAIYNAENLKTAFYGKPVIITESPMDTLSVLQQGLISVSTLSARLNERHLKIISRYTDKIVIFFDSDSAGQMAAQKALKRFGADYNLYNFILKGGKDANEMLQRGLDESLKSQLQLFMERI